MNDQHLIQRIAATLREAETVLPPPSADQIGDVRHRYERATRLRRRLATTATVVAVATIVLAVAPLGGWLRQPAADGAAGTIRMWVVRNTPVLSGVLQSRIDAFDRSSGLRIQVTTFSAGEYQARLRASLGSSGAPDIFVNWGGGDLAQLVRAGDVADLTGALGRHPGVARAFLPKILDLGVVDGRQYGLPMSGIQPFVMYYNKRLFTEAGVRPPETYDDLLSLVDTFRERGITPIALAGSRGWTELAYLMYLVDRIGGPGKAADIVAGRPGAWQDPAVVEAARRCQDLVRLGAFNSDFAWLDVDGGEASARLATGRAAMYLMGSWEYAQQLDRYPDFVEAGALGWAAFPAVPGGSGDPRDLVGVPANFFSVASGSRHVDAAADFLARTMASDAYVSGLVEAGDVPAVSGVGSKLAGTANAGFATFTHRLVTDAPSFTLAWDQALAPTIGSQLTSSVRALFLERITPEQFATQMAGAT